MNDLERLRLTFRPLAITTVFLGESPPQRWPQTACFITG
jgi:hypothetical protein